MTVVDHDIVEMPVDSTVGAMPPYRRILGWVRAEVDGLTSEQLDFDDTSPDNEWMWWSIRRQVSHMAWDSLVFTHRRCAHLLWPDGDEPEPVVWVHHHLGPNMKYDRMLDEDLFWDVADLTEKMEIGVSWLERVVSEHTIDQLRSDTTSIRGTEFWAYVITTLPRGASADPDRPGYIRYDLEGSLWMVFYELLTHIRTIQRLKTHQGIALRVELPRVGYLRLPEYWGDTNANGPPMKRLDVGPAPEPDYAQELQQCLDEDPVLQTAFAALTRGRRREYNLYISGAKQSTTRAARVNKCVPRILAGKGLRGR